jgi:hypothetical protein
MKRSSPPAPPAPLVLLALCALCALCALLAVTASCTTVVYIGEPSGDAGGDGDGAPPPAVDKVDLLFVVDNSKSMADKQDALAKRIPRLLQLLTQIGVDPITGGVPKVVDLHVAVITSSLGSQGTSACDPKQFGPHVDDAAHLLPRVGEPPPKQGYAYVGAAAEPSLVACPTIVPGAPIRWVLDPTRASSAEVLRGAADLAKLEAAVSCTVLSAGEDGCGYEMPLEAMYRFLVDPVPASTREAACNKNPAGDQCGNSRILSSGRDDALLAQRAAFLRPDSLLAIVLITDESDSSLRAEGINWLPWATAPGQMKRGFEKCAGVPDDFEVALDVADDRLHEIFICSSCNQTLSDSTKDANCALGWPSSNPKDHDDVDGMNLRAFHQIQRYGYDFLYPTSRYVDALTKDTVNDDSGASHLNPIFAAGMRTHDRVLLAGIVGVPPALVNDASGYPKYLGTDDWPKLISRDPSLRDTHMVESIGPRYRLPLFAGDPAIDPINGGERVVADGDDLQYACLGPVATLSQPAPECAVAGAEKRDPACLAGGGMRIRAYPSLRPLRVIHGVGNAGYVASICDDDYRGAIAGIATMIGEASIAAP